MSHTEPLAPQRTEPGDPSQYSARLVQSSEKYLETMDGLNERLRECFDKMANDPKQQEAMRAEIAKLNEERNSAFEKMTNDFIAAFKEYMSALANYREALKIDNAGRGFEEEPAAEDSVKLAPLADSRPKKDEDLEKRSKLNEDLLNALKSSKSPTERAEAVNKANEEAHQQYRAKQSESSAKYRETMDALNAKHQECCNIMVKDPGQYEAMMKEIAKLDKERDAAYAEMGNDSVKAFKEYSGAINENHEALRDYNAGREAETKPAARASVELAPLRDDNSTNTNNNTNNNTPSMR